MKCNIGKKDRIFRYLLGSVIILLGIYYKSWWGALGLLPILVATIRWCPAYAPFGFSTCHEEKESA
jgi:hypothetical protein